MTVPAATVIAARRPTGVAGELAELVEQSLGVALPFRLRAWDGTQAGPDAKPLVTLRSPRALQWLLWNPGELGLARAYVTGDLDIDGDVDDALQVLRRITIPAQRLRAVPSGVRALGIARKLGVLRGRPKAPEIEARLPRRWMPNRLSQPHTRRRDRAVIAHHYDASNAFYALILDPQMAYSCAYWTPETDHADLETAQRAKFDLICRKLGLAPRMQLLDIGCGWGGLAIHAARHYGVHVTGITLSTAQLAYARRAVDETGLGELVDLRLQDYRDLPSASFDAVSTIEMGEHVGATNYPLFTATLHRVVRPGGRVLVQQMSRRGKHPTGGPFIERYVAPDMYMRPVGETVDLIEQAGLEVRDVQALRENYVRTIRAWRDRLEARWEDAVGLVGFESARMWRLYLAGSALAFEQGRMGVDQILAVRPGGHDLPAQPQR